MSVREAAERLNRYLEDRTITAADYEDCEGDIQYVATAYLTEHPADEDNPIDEAWLREIGFEETRDGGLFLPDVEGVFVRNKSMKCVFDWKLEPPSCKLIGCFETRRQLRKLLDALGIETKGGDE